MGYDPGSCSKTEGGSLKLIKNRLNNDKLLICTEERGVYAWKTTDGNILSVHVLLKSDCQREHTFLI